MLRRISPIQFLSGGAFLASFTFIPIYARELGLSNLEITVIATLYATASLLSFYATGRLADRYGRRVVLRWGLFGAALFTITQALSWNFPSITAFRMLAGLGFGLYPAALAAYAYEAKVNIGRFSSFEALGWGIFLPIAGFVAEFASVRYVFILASSCLAVSFLFSMGLGPIMERKIRTPLLPFGMIRKNAGTLLPIFIRHATASAIWVLWPVFLKEELGLAMWEIGIVQAANALTQFVTMFIIGDRLRPGISVGAGLIATSIAAFSFTLMIPFPFFLITQIVLGISWSLLFVGSLREMIRKNRERATSVGVLRSTISLSAFFGPMISFVIIWALPSTGYAGPMILASAASLAAFGIHYLFSRKNSRPTA